jgi:Asp-tRNA(Asn)/Glu-tRNA(Gln) amidotransferase A subunit family amidase
MTPRTSIINVPMGDVFGLPVGISLIGTAFSEATVIALLNRRDHHSM